VEKEIKKERQRKNDRERTTEKERQRKNDKRRRKKGKRKKGEGKKGEGQSADAQSQKERGQQRKQGTHHVVGFIGSRVIHPIKTRGARCRLVATVETRFA